MLKNMYYDDLSQIMLKNTIFRFSNIHPGPLLKVVFSSGLTATSQNHKPFLWEKEERIFPEWVWQRARNDPKSTTGVPKQWQNLHLEDISIQNMKTVPHFNQCGSMILMSSLCTLAS